MEFDINPLFIDVNQRQLFVINYTPLRKQSIASIIYLPPFAEEMHKSRHMVAEQARQFARRGYHVMTVDLTGCGDSSGEFEEATWELWKEDAKACYDWITSTQPAPPIILWGLRTGALLATQLSEQIANVHKLLLWQPIIYGDQFVSQFIRQKLAAHNILSKASKKLETKSILDELNLTGYIEVGGYKTTNKLLSSLSSAKITDTVPKCQVFWFELGIENKDHLCFASNQAVEIWKKKRAQIETKTIKGQPFWSTQEIVNCPDLIEATNKIIN